MTLKYESRVQGTNLKIRPLNPGSMLYYFEFLAHQSLSFSSSHLLTFSPSHLLLNNCGILETFFANRIHKGKGILLFLNTQ